MYLSIALLRTAFTSSCQLRYEQAKHVDGLQSDGWILLKCFRSRVMGLAHRDSLLGLFCRQRHSWLATQTLISSIRTAGQLVGAERSSEKPCIKAYTAILSRPAVFIQHLLVFWLINSVRQASTSVCSTSCFFQL